MMVTEEKVLVNSCTIAVTVGEKKKKKTYINIYIHISLLINAFDVLPPLPHTTHSSDCMFHTTIIIEVFAAICFIFIQT